MEEDQHQNQESQGKESSSQKTSPPLAFGLEFQRVRQRPEGLACVPSLTGEEQASSPPPAQLAHKKMGGVHAGGTEVEVSEDPPAPGLRIGI